MASESAYDGGEPIGELAARLREFRVQAGNPSVNQLVALTKRQGRRLAMTRSTIQDKLSGHTAPKIEHVLALVKAFAEHAESTGVSLSPQAVDEHSWREDWERMTRALAKPRRELARAARAVRKLAAAARADEEPMGELPPIQDGVAEEVVWKAQEEFDRGSRDSAGFVREVPWHVMEDLAHRDFDVRSWIEQLSRSWGYTAAGYAPEGASLPPWWTVAARYLGNLADPIGYDQYSFRCTDRYVQGFGAGLRSAWQAAEAVGTQTAPTVADAFEGATSPPQGRQVASSGTTPVAAAADRINDLLRGHGGLPLARVDQVGGELLGRLRSNVERHLQEAHLPDNVHLKIEEMCVPNCTFNDELYRLVQQPMNSVKITVELAQPVQVRTELTLVPGISSHRDAEYALIVIDANRPRGEPLHLRIEELHPNVTDTGISTIDHWVVTRTSVLLNEVSAAIERVLQQRGYRM